MITDEAVEAAIGVFFDGLPYIHPESKAKMRAALEAAAPRMLARAWGEGERAGYINHAFEDYPPQECIKNPYR